MKNSFYFDHDYNARGDQKILCLRAKYNWSGYGLFFATLECLCESGGFIVREALPGVSLGLNTPETEYTLFIDYCIKINLLNEDEMGIFSDRILDHLEYRKTLSEAGKRGGRGNKRVETKPPFSHPLATPEAVKESKVKESKVKESKVIKEKAFVKPIWAENFKEYHSGIIYPFEMQDFCQAWDLWIAYRSERRLSSYKPIGEQGALHELSRLSNGNLQKALQIIKQSISKGWQGFFDLKQGNNGKISYNHRESAETINSIIDEAFKGS